MKKPISKFGTILIILITVILAGVAIFTAYRLFQLRQEPVAPNVPSSLPKAADGSEGSTCGFDESVGKNIECAPGLICDKSAPSLGGGMGVCRASKSSCSLSFTITAPTTPTPVPGLSCTSKRAWQDDSRNTPSVYYLTKSVSAGSDITPGQKLVYSLSYKNTGTTVVNSASFTDVLPSQVSFLDADSGCSYNSSTRTVTCNLNNVAVGESSQRAVRVQVSDTAVAGSLINKASLQASGVDTSTCQIALNIQTSTNTPTSSPTPTTSTSSPTPTVTGTPAPGTASPTPAPTEAALPVSGTNWPTLLGAGIGIMVILGAILLAL